MSAPAAPPEPDWTFDVMTSSHEAVKAGVLAQRRSRVVISRTAFPTFGLAAETAGCLAVAVHGGMPTAILVRL